MPTRKILRSPVKVTGTAPDGQEFESTLEEDFFALLRFNRLIDRFESQTVTIDWADDTGKIRRYTPDVLVFYRKDLEESKDLRPKLCEIKPDLKDPNEVNPRKKPPRSENEEENLLKWAAAERYAARQGWEFEVFRESAIRTPYLKNAKFLLRALERPIHTYFEAEMLDCLRTEGSMNIEKLVSKFGSTINDRARIYPTCYRLIAQQKISADLTQQLSLNTVVAPINAT